MRQWHYTAVAGKRKDVLLNPEFFPVEPEATRKRQSDSALTYIQSVITAANKRLTLAHKLKLLLFHILTNTIMNIGGVKYLIPGISPPQLPTFLYIPTDSYGMSTQPPGNQHERHMLRDGIGEFISGSLSSWRTNPGVGRRLSR